MELLNIRKVPREITLPVLIFAFIYDFTDFNILIAWNMRPPMSWWGYYRVSPIMIVENIIIPVLLFLVVYRRSSLLSDQGSLGRFLISIVIYGGIGVFLSTSFGLLYPKIGQTVYWGSFLNYVKWRIIEYAPKLVFPSIAALMYGRLQRARLIKTL